MTNRDVTRYNDYLSMMSRTHEEPISELRALGVVMDFDYWRSLNSPDYIESQRVKREQIAPRQVQALKAAFEIPLEDRLKAIAVLDLITILKGINIDKVRTETELKELEEFEAMESAGAGDWS